MGLLLLVGGFMVALTFSRRALAAQEIMHIVLFATMSLIAARLVLWPVLFLALILPKAWPVSAALDRAEDYEKLFDDGVVAFYRKREGG